MSKHIATKMYLISTDIGNVAVVDDLIEDYSVEDIISDRAHSQALVLKMLRQGQSTTFQPNEHPLTVLSKYKNSQEEFEE